MEGPRWLTLTWRLPSDSSTPRVATWRTLRRVGAVLLTPGAAIVPYSEDLLEKLDWLAQSIEEAGGEAWVLPVQHLSDREEAEIRDRQRRAREDEYDTLARQARKLPSASRAREGLAHVRRERALSALERGLVRVEARDHFHAAGKRQAAEVIVAARAR
ncbi:MAG TPA: Chromate resistance protein ChrB [Candidatus Acidoferrales bacterium]|nr:Chromate resistance protein ChrB [Candidatus Acidoferrales bacterium]